ncbi:MAG TPA: YncE family protein [Stellaceae bacterium]|nr:YncE family protein [Stellaceae bacterium]
MRKLTLAIAIAAVAVSVLGHAGPARAQFIIVGNDEKVLWDDAGKTLQKAPGNDTVMVLDIANRVKPRTAAVLKLENSVVGPPTNLAITPDEHLALVANSLDQVSDGSGGWKAQPDNKVYVIDLKASPPAQIGTVEVGKQPSGMAINRAGDLALVTNRAENSVSVLSIKGKDVKLVGTIPVSPQGAASEQVSAVAISPDGKLALAVKAATNKVALLRIDGQKVTYDGYDMNVGVFPYNAAVVPGGEIAIVNNNGGGGYSDGGVDTVAVIDMKATPPRVIDYVVVGDGPEGLAVSPTGKLAVSVILNGAGNVAKSAFFHHDHAYLSILKIDGKRVQKVGEVEVGGLAEGAAFSPDGKYLYVGNYLDSDMTIFKVEGSKLVRAASMKLPGHPASLRSAVP